MKRVAFVGSRDYPDMDEVRGMVQAYKDCEVVSGGARGVDSVAVEEATRLGCPTKVFPADWDTHGKRAGAVRNQQIVDYSDMVVAFWDGKSKGTVITVDMARRAGKDCVVIQPIETLNTPPAP